MSFSSKLRNQKILPFFLSFSHKLPEKNDEVDVTREFFQYRFTATNHFIHAIPFGRKINGLIIWK